MTGRQAVVKRNLSEGGVFHGNQDRTDRGCCRGRDRGCSCRKEAVVKRYLSEGGELYGSQNRKDRGCCRGRDRGCSCRREVVF